MKPPFTVIAIDGPAASGKSSVARALAQHLGFACVNTGAMYRAVTWHVLRHGVDPRDAAAVCALLERSQIQCAIEDGASVIRIDGDDPAPHLTEPAVNAHVSAVAGIPEVRARLVALQRALANLQPVVMEGRDIGSDVFPATPHKFYIDATPEVRARRRAAQGFHDAIGARDAQDATRQASPLRIAPDARIIDSSHLDVRAVVGQIIGCLRAQGLQDVPAP